MRTNTLKLSFMVVFLICSDIFAQISANNKVDCDSLLEAINYKGFMSVEMPSPLKSFEQIQNEFISKVDTNLLMETIYIEVIIDTNGLVLCPKVIKGNGNATDSIALNYVTDLKFIPANQRERKLPVSLTIPFYKWSLDKTTKMIKIDGKWILKE